MLTAPSCPTAPLYPTPRIPSSLAWDKLRNHYGGAVHPLRYGKNWLQEIQLAFGHVLFLLYPSRALMVGPYADSSKLSYNTTLYFTTDTILPDLG